MDCDAGQQLEAGEQLAESGGAGHCFEGTAVDCVWGRRGLCNGLVNCIAGAGVGPCWSQLV